MCCKDRPRWDANYLLPNFDSPVLRRPGGSEYNSGEQDIPVKREINAIAIGEDSMVDMVDIFINGDATNESHRIRVSAEHPWYGSIRPGEGVDKLVIVPAFAIAPLGTIFPEGLNEFTYPRARVRVYGGDLPSLPTERAMGQYDFVQTTVNANETQTIDIPTSGRRSVSFFWRLFNGAGGFASADIRIYGIDTVFDETTGFVYSNAELLTTVNTLLNADDSWVYEGTPWKQMAVQIDPNAGTFAWGLAVALYDRI